MSRAESALTAGNREQARDAYREAARTYPTSKLPWTRLAENYFETADYGNAILASQEVVQRDPQELVAHSILAVVGLRVSTTALAALREQQSGVPGSTRDEAVSLTRKLRETLGETVLVPAGVVPVVPPKPRPRPPAARPATAAQPPVARPATPAQPPAASVEAKPAPAAPKPAASPNPFDRLK